MSELPTSEKQFAPFIWHDMDTAPNGRSILVAYDDGGISFVLASENDYEWEPYDGKRERGIQKPKHWMWVEAPK